jgi:hypothetical protein
VRSHTKRTLRPEQRVAVAKRPASRPERPDSNTLTPDCLGHCRGTRRVDCGRPARRGAGARRGRAVGKTRGCPVSCRWVSDILARLTPWSSRPQAGQSTAGGSPLVRGGVVGRASPAPDQDSGLHLPPRRVRILTSDSASQPTNADQISVSPAVGFIPRLNSWAFASKRCNGPERTGWGAIVE